MAGPGPGPELGRPVTGSPRGSRNAPLTPPCPPCREGPATRGHHGLSHHGHPAAPAPARDIPQSPHPMGLCPRIPKPRDASWGPRDRQWPRGFCDGGDAAMALPGTGWPPCATSLSPHPEDAMRHLLSPRQDGHQGLHLPLLAQRSKEPPLQPPGNGDTPCCRAVPWRMWRGGRGDFRGRGGCRRPAQSSCRV